MEKEKRKHSEPRQNLFLLFLSFIWKAISGAGKGIGWFMSLLAVGAWWLLKKTGNGIGWMLKQSGQTITWIIKQPYRLLRYIISGRIPDFENARQEEIFWRIKRQYRRKRLFLINSLGYSAAIIFFLLIAGDRYLSWQRAIAENVFNPDRYLTSFYDTLMQGGLFIGLWTVILIFHFVFNRMGDSEDTALGEALENEYSRSEAREQAHRSSPDIARLTGIPQEEYYADYEEEKPKRNGART